MTALDDLRSDVVAHVEAARLGLGAPAGDYLLLERVARELSALVDDRGPTPPRPEPPERAETAAETAQRLTFGDRHDDYGHPLDDFSRTGALWSAVLGVDVTAEQVALCMALVKISRLCNTPDHWDSVVDLAGYANCYGMVLTERARRGGG